MTLSLAPLAAEVPPIPAHALVACALIVLGAVIFMLPKGSTLHRQLGWVFVVGMAFVAISGLFISETKMFGYFSPIHLIIPYTLISLVLAVRAARRGAVTAHRKNMISLYTFALIVAGAFTLFPGRVMHAVVFGG